jgi:hypothetical protein
MLELLLGNNPFTWQRLPRARAVRESEAWRVPREARGDEAIARTSLFEYA